MTPRASLFSRLHLALLVGGLALSSSACDAKTDDKTDDKGDKDADVKSGAQEKLSPGEAAVEHAIDEANKELSEDARFDKALQKKACEYLTAKMVADTFGVAEGELKQHKIMGCIYSWKGDGQIVESRMSMLRAHKSEKSAAGWFDLATRSLTKAELAQQMEMVKKKVKDRKEIDTKLKEKTADGVADLVTGMTPDEGVQYEDVPGVGDQARVNLGEGTLWVRVDNLTFTVGAYKGPDQPKVDINPRSKPKDMIAASMAAQKKWTKDTKDQRKDDAIKIAKLIVAALD